MIKEERLQQQCRNRAISCDTEKEPHGTKTGSQKPADLKFEFVERLRQRCVASDLVHKLATGNVLKDYAAGVLAQNKGQEGALQVLLCIGLDVHPVPINTKGLGE